jgi:hypothetical protein
MKKKLLLIVMVFTGVCAMAQKESLPKMSAGFPVNYEDDSVGNYVLPELLTLNNGQKVTTAKTWTKKRRPELLQLFEEIEYGKMPGKPAELHFNVFDKGTAAFNGKAIRKQVTVYFTKDTTDHKMDILIYIPANATAHSFIIEYLFCCCQSNNK